MEEYWGKIINDFGIKPDKVCCAMMMQGFAKNLKVINLDII